MTRRLWRWRRIRLYRIVIKWVRICLRFPKKRKRKRRKVRITLLFLILLYPVLLLFTIKKISLKVLRKEHKKNHKIIYLFLSRNHLVSQEILLNRQINIIKSLKNLKEIEEEENNKKNKKKNKKKIQYNNNNLLLI